MEKDKIRIPIVVDSFNYKNRKELAFMYPDGILIELKVAKDYIKKLQKTYNRLSSRTIFELNTIQKEYLTQELEGTKQSKFPKEKKRGYVYFLKSGKYIKIGRCKVLQKRISQIKTLSPDLTITHTIKTNDCIQCEKYFHEKYIKKRGNGEWFSLDETDIKKIKRIRQKNFK